MSHPLMASIPSRGSMIAAFGRSGAGDMAAKAAVLVTTIAAARLLEPATFAIYAGLLAVALLGAACWDAGISTLVTVAASRQAPIGSMIRRVIVARAIALPVWLVAIGLGFLVFGSMANVGWASIALVGACSLGATINQPLHAILRGHLHFGRTGVAAATGRWTTAGLTVVLLVIKPTGNPLPALFLAQFAGEVAMLAVSAMFVSRLSSDFRDSPWDPREIGIRRAIPFAANGVLNIAYNRLDIVVVATLTTTAQLAAYTPASRLQDSLYLVPTALSAIALPYLSRALARPDGGEASRALVRQLWRTGLVLTIPLAGVLILAMPAVINVLLGADYEASVPAARILTLSMIVAVMGGPILALLVAAGRGPATTKAFVAAFGASLALHLTLDWWLGSVGAAIASTARDVVNLAVAAYLSRDLLRTPRRGPDVAVHGAE